MKILLRPKCSVVFRERMCWVRGYLESFCRWLNYISNLKHVNNHESRFHAYLLNYPFIICKQESVLNLRNWFILNIWSLQAIWKITDCCEYIMKHLALDFIDVLCDNIILSCILSCFYFDNPSAKRILK